MRLVLVALSGWTVAVMGLVIARAFLSVDDPDGLFSSPMTSGEAVVATLLTIPTMLLGILVMVGLRPVKQE
jgi:hypothetical protein